MLVRKNYNSIEGLNLHLSATFLKIHTIHCSSKSFSAKNKGNY